LVLQDHLDKDGGSMEHADKTAKERLQSYMHVLNLTDIFRKLHPFKKSYAGIQSQPYATTRLDFFLVGNKLCHRVQSCSIGQSFKSDHKIVSVEVNLQQIERGTRYWKLNTSILNDDNYVSLIKQLIREFQINNPKGHASPSVLWETL